MDENNNKFLQKRKMLYLSKDAEYIYKRIEETSEKTGLSQNRIIETCMICGFGFLYGDVNDKEMIIEIMKNRHGNLFDLEKMSKIYIDTNAET